MAFAKQTSAAVDEVRPYLHGVAIREVLSERMLQHALQRQAADPAAERPPEFQHCPGCNGVTDADDPEPRLVQTRTLRVADDGPAGASDVDDSAAHRDWGHAPAHDLATAFGEYLIPSIRKHYA